MGRERGLLGVWTCYASSEDADFSPDEDGNNKHLHDVKKPKPAPKSRKRGKKSSQLHRQSEPSGGVNADELLDVPLAKRCVTQP